MGMNMPEHGFYFGRETTGIRLLQELMEHNPFISLTDAIYEIVSEDIVHYRILPETRLVVSKLAEELCVSRTPVKAALAMLERDGLVCERSGKGFFVAPFDQQDYLRFYALRAEIESGAARLAAKRITKRELALLHRLHRQLKLAYKELDWNGITNGEQRFHQQLVACSDNPYYISAYRSLFPQIRRYRIYVIFDEANHTEYAALHEMILLALESGSPELCEAAVRTHLSRYPLSYEKNYLHVKQVFESRSGEGASLDGAAL